MDIIGALKRVFGIGENLTDPEQYDIKVMKRLRYNLEAAKEYIFVDEKSGQYADITEKRRKKLKVHYRKRVFDES